MSMHSYSISKNSTLDLYKAIKRNTYYFTFHTRTHKALERVVRCDTMTIQSSKLVDFHSLRGCDYLARVVSGLVFPSSALKSSNALKSVIFSQIRIAIPYFSEKYLKNAFSGYRIIHLLLDDVA